QQYSPEINLIRDIPADANIVYMGESSNDTFDKDDRDKRPISAFISDYFPGLIFSDVTKHAGHAGIYYTLLSNIPDSSDIQTLIITLNLRSFNAQWIYSKLETSLQKSMVMIKPNPPLLNRFILSFKAYDIKNDNERLAQVKRKWKNETLHFPYSFQFKNVKEWDADMSKKGIKNTDGTKNQELTELACHYIKGYAFQIDIHSNPRIKDFDKIIKLAKKRGWNLVLNLMAENTMRANELVGSDLVYLMEQNRKILTEHFQSKDVIVVDNLNALADNQFIDTLWTTEHYFETGRKTIANNVANSIKQLYPDQYIDMGYPNSAHTFFFNDCEGNTLWEPLQTITDENAFSGKYSSKTGKGNNFSITFEYPLSEIPDSAKNTINVDFKVYQYSMNSGCKFVIQAEGKKIEKFWYGTPITNQVKNIEQWSDYSYSFTIPGSIKQADIIKIYVFNPTNEIVFIDNFRVKFD
ncbi:MAG: hypothetical protein J7L96_07645, partial [Bacteroidales bacterium]|nr:hypothetical protein [Bacteroidales bacterium]